MVWATLLALPSYRFGYAMLATDLSQHARQEPHEYTPVASLIASALHMVPVLAGLSACVNVVECKTLRVLDGYCPYGWNNAPRHCQAMDARQAHCATSYILWLVSNGKPTA